MTVGFVNGVPQVNLTGVLTGNGAGSAVTASSLTQHGVVVAGASNVLSTVAPGANNNVLTSNGTDWTSAVPALTNSARPCFSAYLSAVATNFTGDNSANLVIFDTVSFDNASNYSNSTGLFTAPVTGKYLFTVDLFGLSSAPAISIFNTIFQTNSSTKIFNAFGASLDYSGFVYASVTYSQIVSLSANDTLGILCEGLTATAAKVISLQAPSNGVQCAFSGVLLC